MYPTLGTFCSQKSHRTQNQTFKMFEGHRHDWNCYGLFRQSLNGTGTGNLNLTDIMPVHSHCNGNGNLSVCLRVLN